MQVYSIIGRCALAFAVFLLGVQPAWAARIYNFLPVQAQVSGSHGDAVVLYPDQKSESLNWWGSKSGIDISIWSPKHMGPPTLVCPMNFGGLLGHAEITGGHYLIIGHTGPLVVCSLCDSDYKLIQRKVGHVPEAYFAEFGSGSTKTSC